VLLEALAAEQLGADGLVGVRKGVVRGTQGAEEGPDGSACTMVARRRRYLLGRCRALARDRVKGSLLDEATNAIAAANGALR
jgi:hypothetical protein